MGLMSCDWKSCSHPCVILPLWLWRFFLSFFLLIALGGGGARAAEPVVWLALSEEGGAYREAAAALRAELGREAGAVLALPWQELLAAPRPVPRLVVTLGSAALRAFVEGSGQALPPSAPVLATLITRAAFERLVPMSAKRAYSAQYLDQPLARQFALLNLLQPPVRRVGVLLGPDSRNQWPALQSVAAASGVQLAFAFVESEGELFRLLQGVLADCQALLALPDALVYNSQTIRNILLAAFRQRVPLIGFSPAYARSGALLALYSTPTQAGRAAAFAVRNFLRGGPLPPPGPMEDFEVVINDNVARSLGFELPPAEALTQRLKQLEGRW